MNIVDTVYERQSEIISVVSVAPNIDALHERLKTIFPDLGFTRVLTRAGWYRIGGVVGPGNERVADNLVTWAEQKCGGDISKLLSKYGKSSYIATRLNGQTHFLVAVYGKGADDFIQLEVEELHEVTDWAIEERDWHPDSVEEFVDPTDIERLPPQPVAEPRFLFRRITPLSSYLKKLVKNSEAPSFVQRFFQDWENSSARDYPLCEKWVFQIREYTDAYGEPVMQAKPVSTFSGEMSELDPDASARGAELANLIHAFDRNVGYPMAWYFYMLTRKKVSPRIAEAIHNDLIGAYDYLPARDLKVLKAWADYPYSV